MTQCERIVRHMNDIGSIDPMIAMQDYGIMRLASRISDLRRMGIPVQREMVRHVNRYGEITHYARYSLIR